MLSRHKQEIRRLSQGFESGVGERHVSIAVQLHESGQEWIRHCTYFARDHINRALPDESVRPFLDRVYREAKDMFFSFLDF